MRKLSATIITYNEERNIARCIDSMGELASEVIVVDSGSSDRTVEIAVAKGAKVFHHKWCGYSEQKNWANEQASNNLILSIDADEALSDELKTSISEVLSGNDVNFKFSRKANYCGKWISHCWYPDTKFRIFDRRKTKWEGTIHEKLNFPESKAKTISGNLLHYSYYNISEHVAQSNKFSDLSALSLLQSGRKPNLLSLIINPFFRFFKFYVLKLGVLDGFYGFVISVISAQEVFLKYAKFRRLYNNKEA